MVLAALLAQGAPVTLADEPTASLAPTAARRMADLMLAPGRTTMVVEHKPGPVLDRIDRRAGPGRDGRVMAEGLPHEVMARDGAALAEAGIALPLATRLHLALPDAIDPRRPLPEALHRLPPVHAGRLHAAVLPAPIPAGQTVVTLEDADCGPAFGPVADAAGG